MQKISKKIILIKFFDEICFNIFKMNFYLVSFDNIQEINNSDISLYKKGLYRYILPGKFKLPIKMYFLKHTYINFDFTINLIETLINNKNIVVFKYNNIIFLNNINILRNKQINSHFEYLNNIVVFKKLLLICLVFYVD